MGLLVAGTLAFTGLAVAGHPELSDDLYRYAWDGHVQASGIDPYRYPPDDPRLSGLRDPWLWPDLSQTSGRFRSADRGADDLAVGVTGESR
jgi:hypothetical protein